MEVLREKTTSIIESYRQWLDQLDQLPARELKNSGAKLNPVEAGVLNCWLQGQSGDEAAEAVGLEPDENIRFGVVIETSQEVSGLKLIKYLHQNGTWPLLVYEELWFPEAQEGFECGDLVVMSHRRGWVPTTIRPFSVEPKVRSTILDKISSAYKRE